MCYISAIVTTFHGALNMKTLILALLVFASVSSQAAIKFNGKQGEIYTGIDKVTGQACSLEIVLVGKNRFGKLTAALKVRSTNLSFDTIVSDLDVLSLRGGMRGANGENFYSNLFLNKTSGALESYDLSDFNTEIASISCEGLKKN